VADSRVRTSSPAGKDAADLLDWLKEHPDIRAELPTLLAALGSATGDPTRDEVAEWFIERAEHGETGGARLLLALASLLLARGEALPRSLQEHLTVTLARLAVGDRQEADRILNLRATKKGWSRTAGVLDRELRIAAQARKAYREFGRWEAGRDANKPGACDETVRRMNLDISAERVNSLRKKWESAVDKLEEEGLLDTDYPYQWIAQRYLEEQREWRELLEKEEGILKD
jgi:hypothetical protein